MAKFCTNCGRPLNEGEVCNCVANTVATASSKASFDAKDSMNVVMTLIKGLFTKPVEAIKEYINSDNTILSSILIVLSGIATGLFGIVLVKEVFGSIMGLFMGGYSSLLTGSLNMEIPYFKIFLLVAIAVIIVYFLQAAIAYVVANKFFKIDMNFKNMMHLFAAISVFTTLAVLVSILGVYVSMYIVYACLFASSIFTTVVLALTLRETFKAEASHVMYVIFSTMFIVTAITLFVVPKLFA